MNAVTLVELSLKLLDDKAPGINASIVIAPK
jgi:hypothetical protein